MTEAVAVGRRAVSVAPEDDPDRGAYLSNFSNALHTQFDLTGDLAVLIEAVEVARRAVAATSGHPDGIGSADPEGTGHGHPDAGLCLANASLHLWVLSEWTGEVETLIEAADLGRRAVEATPVGHIDHAVYLANLGGTLRRLFPDNVPRNIFRILFPTELCGQRDRAQRIHGVSPSTPAT